MLDVVGERLDGLVLKGLPKEKTLEASLEAYTKPSLLKLAELNAFDVKKSWNKTQMIEVIADSIKNSLDECVSDFDEKQLETLKGIANETAEDTDLQSEGVASAVEKGLLYVAANEEDVSFSMPAEVAEKVSEVATKNEPVQAKADSVVKEDSRPIRTAPFSIRSRRKKKVQQRIVNKIGRNEPCPCGSGKKYKKCCLA
ncbi:hypothetical protein GCM10008932_22670 [Alkalibacterium iburiense]|uniref:Uncharacterized protein n=1 Tax=Alkalibacterium iburiense TaxID=290589 RepID=A0ABN0XR05_9LACT